MNELVVSIGAVVAAVVGGWAAARKAVGAVNLRAVVGSLLDERSRYSHSVVVAGHTAAAAFKAAGVLQERGFKHVRVVDRDAPPQVETAGDAVVVYAAKPDADLRGLLAGPLGVVYVEGRVQLPAGDWTAANSRVTLHARLLECIEYARAAG